MLSTTYHFSISSISLKTESNCFLHPVLEKYHTELIEQQPCIKGEETQNLSINMSIKYLRLFKMKF